MHGVEDLINNQSYVYIIWERASLDMLNMSYSKKIKRQKTKQLDKILHDNRNAPAQGSKDWLKQREKSVGGSDMALFMPEITGNKPYGTIRGFAEQKLGIREFTGNKYTRWGHLCENITRQYTEKMFHTTVYETGALPGCIPNHHYSPDGLGVVKKKWLKPHVSTQLFKSLPDYAFVLFEYKNPFSRIPNNQIPKHYEIQLHTGMNDIKSTDIGIFVDMAIRKCSLDDLDYTTNYHRQYFNDIINFGIPECIGFIGIAEPVDDLDDATSETLDEEIDYTTANFRRETEEFSRTIDEEDFIDFGGTSDENFRIMASGIYSGKYKPFYTDLEFGHKKFKYYTWYIKFLEFCEEEYCRPIGIMPWKIFRTHIIPLEKIPDFIKPVHAERINDAIQFIETYKTKSLIEKQQALDRKYPKYNKNNSMVEQLFQTPI